MLPLERRSKLPDLPPINKKLETTPSLAKPRASRLDTLNMQAKKGKEKEEKKKKKRRKKERKKANPRGSLDSLSFITALMGLAPDQDSMILAPD